MTIESHGIQQVTRDTAHAIIMSLSIIFHQILIEFNSTCTGYQNSSSGNETDLCFPDTCILLSVRYRYCIFSFLYRILAAILATSEYMP
jgi:hypothetical protein